MYLNICLIFVSPIMALKLSPMRDHELDQWLTFGLPKILNPEASPQADNRIFATPDEPDQPSDLSTLLSFAPRSRYLKVTDAATNEIISSARWEFYNFDTYPYGSAQDRWMYRGPNPIREPPVTSTRIAAIYETRHAVIGVRPHLALSNLVTLPNHRRRGAARMLIQWGLDLADQQDGVDVYLECLEATVPLYEKLGFQTVAVIPFRTLEEGNEVEEGGKRCGGIVCMVRRSIR
ncbi:hypothetical protein GGR53DRAFT_527566 [Hypoxylon sp. FL1150]|nr:hypothetical protein GGR53DRAFT_527566 [Hypoxylon sp. FL1150]